MQNTKKLNQNEEVRFMNKVAAKINLIKPTNLYVIGGRGFSKTTEIVSERLKDITSDMPRSCFGFLADTYVNAMTNIIPNLLMGFERKGWKDGIDYVVDEDPPKHFDKPYLKVFDTKHKIFLRNGSVGLIVSGDRPSSMAGHSIVHFFVDESKYVNNDTIKRLIPALRDSRILYDHSPFFRGITAVTDMPNVNSQREFDWILKMKNNVNKTQNEIILKAALEFNNIIKELLEKGYSPDEIYSNKIFLKWDKQLRLLRKNSTLFVNVSSFANADVLGTQYFKNLYETLDFTDFMVSVLSIEQKQADIKYFGKFNEDIHTYTDGFNYSYYDRFSLKSPIKHTSDGLKYLSPDEKLYGGMDFGNMCSLVVGTEKNNTFKVHKNFYTLTLNEDNQYIPDIAKLFADFFINHKNKNLYLHYDRAGNNYGKHGQAALFKRELESLNRGWIVHLQSIGKKTVYQNDVYDLFDVLFDESKTPIKLRIDANSCEELISSISLSPSSKDKRGYIMLDKSSERTRDLKKLPKYSTNMATAYIYLIEGLYSKYLPGMRSIKAYSVKKY